MKKTLVALAAIAATSAFAQSSVSIYGIADVNYGSLKQTTGSGATRTTTGLGESAASGTRLGFRGTEDLGGGLKAGFLAETALSFTTTDTFGNRNGASGARDITLTTPGAAYAGINNGGYLSAGSSQNRQSYASVAGGYGEVRLGYQYTNLYTLSSLSGYLGGYEGVSGADTAHVYGNAMVGGTRANGFTYISPVFAGGFTATVQYGGGAGNPAVTSTTSAAGSAGVKRTGLKLDYANGPLNAALAYTRAQNNIAAKAAAFAFNSVTGAIDTVPAVAASSATAKLTQFAASYDFGVAKLVGTYNTGNDGVSTGVTNVTNWKSNQIGVKVPFGAVTAFVTFGSAKKDSGGATKEDVKQSQIGAQYALSKRSFVYLVSGTSKDNYALNNASATAGKATDTRLGINHAF